jgi:MoxR-like ATPase
MTDKLFTGTQSKTYVASPEVAEMVNLAVQLRRPLLVEGEAGCGKTRLAYAVAEEKGLGEPVKISVKSTARASDLLWRFDALRRLQDAQKPGDTTAQHIYPYLSLGDLGQAISSGAPCVVLIDEIDKADIDFPNDLLDVLDTFEFEVRDLPDKEEGLCRKHNGFGRTVKAPGDVRPIVIITSNREKRLPEAFLRRCLYVRVRFPREEDRLADIVRKNTGLAEGDLGKTLMRAAVQRFIDLRDHAIAADAQKPPSTSELIDWVRILHWKGASLEQLQEEAALPPYWRTLFKTYPDLEAFEAKEKGSQGGDAP